MRLSIKTDIWRKPLDEHFKDHKAITLGRWDDDGEVNLREFTEEEMQRFEDLVADVQPGLRRHISSWRKALASPKTSSTTSLEAMRSVLIDMMVDNLIEGWIFTNDEYEQPYQISGVWYNPSSRDNPASVAITGISHGKSLYRSFGWDDAKGKPSLIVTGKPDT